MFCFSLGLLAFRRTAFCCLLYLRGKVMGSWYFFQEPIPSLGNILIKKLEIEKTKLTFVTSVLKVLYYVGLVFSNYNFLLTK